MDEVFGADVVLHVGTHGTLEWLPGKEIGLSSGCFGDICIGGMPHLYIYNISILGEGMQAKRRSYACILDHLIPSMDDADTYGGLTDLDEAIDGYYHARQARPAQVPALLERIFTLAEELEVTTDLQLERADLEAIFFQYRKIAEQAEAYPFIRLLPRCPMLAEAEGLGQQLSLAQERYSTVCLDLLGLIAIGRYQPGDHLPTHDELQEWYGVSRDTTVKAIRMLQDWGVVTAAPRRGISVVMDLSDLKKIQITPESIACHVRRYLDSLDLLSLTVEQVASHAAAQAEPGQVHLLCGTLARQWEQPYEHQLIPRTLLDFITEHIQYDALRSIYGVLARNFSIGRSIPKLVSPDKNPQNCEIYRQCMEAAAILMDGDGALSQAAAGCLSRSAAWSGRNADVWATGRPP